LLQAEDQVELNLAVAVMAAAVEQVGI